MERKQKYFNANHFLQNLNLFEKFFLSIFLLLVPAYRWLPVVSNVVASDIAFLILLIFLGIRFLLTGDPFRLHLGYVVAFCAIFVWLFLGLAFSSAPFAGLDNIIQYLYLFFILLFFTIRGVHVSDIQVLLIGACLFAFYCVGELMFMQITEGAGYIFGSRFLREATHPQVVVSALFPISMILWGGSKKFFYGITSLILYLLLIFSFSRGGLIAVHLVLFFMLFNRNTRRVGLIAWFCIGIVIFILRSVIGSEHFVHFFLRIASIFAMGSDKEIEGFVIGVTHAADRLSLMKTVFLHSLDWKLLWGHGLDSFATDVISFGGDWVPGDEFAKMSTHNLPTMLIYEQGMIGCLLIFLFLIYLLIKLSKIPSKFFLKYGFIFSVMALIINSNTDPGVLVERITWVVLGMALAYNPLKKLKKQCDSGPSSFE